MKKAISMMLATAMAATCLAGCGSAASSSAAASSEAVSSEATSAATSEASTGEKTFENNELNIAVFEGGYGSAYWDETSNASRMPIPASLSICRSARRLATSSARKSWQVMCPTSSR